jgi:hypothetical protein
MKILRIVSLVLSLEAICPGQMTSSEKAADFTQLAATYAVNYGPLDWKRTALNFDLLKIGDWLDKAMKTQDDLDFYELCVSYVASLDDAHDVFVLPSDFLADLGFSVDIYDGKTLIDSINRKHLPATRFPFQIGDELVSLDGVAAQDLIQSLTPYSIAGNQLSTRRIAASSITLRDQSIMPHAHLVPDTSTVVINRQNGRTEAFSIPWTKTGTPITVVGPVIGPSANAPDAALPSGIPDYMRPLMKLRNMRLPARKSLVGLGATAPVFNLPSTFVQRMGSRRFDFFYTGTFQAQGLRIGYIRIPSFDTFLPSDQFQSEIDYMQQNTDGLILDIMRNPGGDPCAAEDLLQRVINTPFRNVGLEIRATWGWVQSFTQALQDAQDFGAPSDVIAQYQDLLQQVSAAYLTPSGRTNALPICDSTLDLQPATDSNNQPIAYTKPLMLLTDELSASAADYFAAVIQDNQRGPLFGMRTMGAGGNVDIFPVTTYSGGLATVTESLMHRKNPVATPDYPTAPYVENIGVRPDVVQNYMTIDNLTNHGSTFVQAFSDAMVKYINTGSVQ